MPDNDIDLNDLAAQAGKQTDAKFASKFASLTSLTNAEITSIITTTGISQQNLAAVITAVKSSTASNTQIANNISNINKGVDVLVAIAKKFL